MKAYAQKPVAGAVKADVVEVVRAKGAPADVEGPVKQRALRLNALAALPHVKTVVGRIASNLVAAARALVPEIVGAIATHIVHKENGILGVIPLRLRVHVDQGAHLDVLPIRANIHAEPVVKRTAPACHSVKVTAI